jgi:transcriptional regulator with XRE-family HTH domain
MAFDNPSNGRTPDPIDVHVGRQLRMARKNRGLSQEALAAALGITFQQVQKYERGDNRLSASKMYAAARFLQAPIDLFFAGLPSPATGDKTAITVPAAGYALIDQRHGRELHDAFLHMPDPDRALLVNLAQRMAATDAGAGQG